MELSDIVKRLFSMTEWCQLNHLFCTLFCTLGVSLLFSWLECFKIWILQHMKKFQCVLSYDLSKLTHKCAFWAFYHKKFPKIIRYRFFPKYPHFWFGDRLGWYIRQIWPFSAQKLPGSGFWAIFQPWNGHVWPKKVKFHKFLTTRRINHPNLSPNQKLVYLVQPRPGKSWSKLWNASKSKVWDFDLNLPLSP